MFIGVDEAYQSIPVSCSIIVVLLLNFTELL